MTTYKNFHGTKEQYIEKLIQDVKFWSKALAEDFKPAFVEALEKAEQMLNNEGYDWETIEQLEIASY
jgi:hypothetical protein